MTSIGETTSRIELAEIPSTTKRGNSLQAPFCRPQSLSIPLEYN